MFAAGDLVGVSNPGWSVALLDAAGELVRTPVPAVAGYRYDQATGALALLSTTESGQVRSTIVRAGRDASTCPAPTSTSRSTTAACPTSS